MYTDLELNRKTPNPGKNKQCRDCAFFPDSPEQNDGTITGFKTAALDSIKWGQNPEPFFCHVGMNIKIGKYVGPQKIQDFKKARVCIGFKHWKNEVNNEKF